MRVAAIQCPVRMDPAAHVGDLAAALEALPPDTLAVAPEGILSGYRPVAGFVAQIDEPATARAIEAARDLARAKRIHLVAGACVRLDGTWRNATYAFSPNGQLWRYDKVNLAWSERADFVAGDELPVAEMVVGGQRVLVGVQMCREIRYPEQWRALAMRGAAIVAYVNNAVGSTSGHDVWRAHVISRAAETQRFVVGANNAADDQLCPSMIVAPDGRVLAEAPIGATTVIMADIDLSAVSDWILDQARLDVSLKPAP